MSDWRPASPAEIAGRRAAMLERARRYFAAAQVLEVDTPALGTASGTDPNVDALTVRASTGAGFFLQTSPEFYMKRLLAAGYPDIYSICRVFRDAESGTEHLVEFTMLEWYRLGFGLDDIVTDTAQLISACLDEQTLATTLDRYDYCDAFRRFAGIDALEANIAELRACAGGDSRLADSLGDDRDAWLDLILATVVASHFAPDRLTVLQHFPASKAALARLCPDDRRVADRFEVFMGSRELANGYVELTDATEQRQRFEGEAALRKQKGRPAPGIDEHLLQALAAGLPECAGVAVGVERLHMVLEKANDISDVVTFAAGNSS